MMDRSTETGRAARERPDGWWYPYIFVVFMAGVFVVNGVMVYFALDTFSGLETRDAYRKGMQYNRNIEKARAQEALGWSLSFDFPTRAATGNARAGTLDVTLRDRDAQPVTGARLRVGFIRPTSDGLDVKLPLVEKGAGLYRVDVALPRPGQWDLRILAERGRDRFREIHRIRVP